MELNVAEIIIILLDAVKQHVRFIENFKRVLIKYKCTVWSDTL